jgi:hypothetical protein
LRQLFVSFKILGHPYISAIVLMAFLEITAKSPHARLNHVKTMEFALLQVQLTIVLVLPDSQEKIAKILPALLSLV